MGNTTSSDGNRIPPKLARPDLINLQMHQILQKLPNSSVDQIYMELKWLDGQAENKVLLENLATRTIACAVVAYPSSCLKYVELAKKLSEFTVNECREEISFKDIFIKKAIEKFDGMKNFTVSYSHTEKWLSAEFLGNLFNVDIISGVLVLHWLTSLIHQPDLQLMMLKVIKGKVEIEFQKPLHNRCIDLLMEMLIENNIVAEPVQVEQTSNRQQQQTVANFFQDWDSTQKRTAEMSRQSSQDSEASSQVIDDNQFDTDSFVRVSSYVPPHERKLVYPVRGVPVTSATAVNPYAPSKPLAPQNFKPATTTNNAVRNIQKDFKAYLETLGASGVQFDLKLFKTCTDKDRQVCAQFMLEFVVSHPQSINEYANVTRDIVCQGSLQSTVHKTFLMYLIDIITDELHKHFQKGTYKHWNLFTNIGKFLGQVYKRDILKPTLLYKWLDGVYNMIPADSNAAKAYLQVLEVIFQTLEGKDKKIYSFHLQNLKNLSSQRQIPQQYLQWTSTIFNRSQGTQHMSTIFSKSQLGTLSKASSMSSVRSEVSTSASSPAKASVTQIQPTATTQICTNFQNFLNDIEAGKNVKFDTKQLSSCSEAAVRGCALILVEHASLYPKNAKLYAAATANSIVSQIAQKELFTQRVSLYFDVELSKWLKVDNPEKSNWDRIKNVGKFLAELYNFEVIKDVAVVGNWIEKIQQADSKLAIEAIMIVYKSVEVKMKQRDINKFKTFMGSAESSNNEKKVAKKFNEMLKDAMKFNDFQSRAKVPLQTYTFTQPAPQSTPCKNMFDELQRTVNVKMNFGNHMMILNEIVAMKIPPTEENLRKITNTLVSRAKQRPDTIPCASQILARLPEAAGYDVSEFRNQIRLSLLRQLDSFCSHSSVEKLTITQFSKFVKELHWKSAIGIKVLSKTIETVALNVRNDPTVGLQVLLVFVKGLGEDLVRKISVAQLQETYTTIMIHKTSSKLNTDTLRDCDVVLDWACTVLKSKHLFKVSPKVPVAAANKPIQSQTFLPSLLPQPSTSHQDSSIQKPPTKDTCLELFSIEGNVDKLQKLIRTVDVSTPEKMKTFSAKFFDAAMNSSQNFAEFSRLARMFDEEFDNNASSFKETITAIVQTNFCDLLEGDDLNHAQVELLVKFVGELYKIEWISGEFLVALMDGLAENNFETHYQLNLFCQLLRVVSLTMVKNGDCRKCENHHQVLTQQRESFKTTKSHLMCLEVLEMLETMMVLSNGSSRKFYQEQVQEILFEIKADAAERVKALQMKTVKDFNAFIELLIEKAKTDPDDAVACARLVVEIQQLKIESTETSLKCLLIDSCQEKILCSLSDGIKHSQLSDTTGLLRFIGELHIVDVLSFDFIELCLELMTEDESDDAADCLKVLLGHVGSKVEYENGEKLSEYFDKFEELAEREKSYRATVMTELIEMRENGWCHAGTIWGEAESGSSVEEVLSELTVINLTSAAVAIKNFIDESDEKLFELIRDLWKFVIAGRDPEVYAKFCIEVSIRQASTTFHDQLVNFVQRRNVTFRSIKKEEFSEAIKTRLGNVIAFISELFNKGFVADEVLQSWIQLKLAKQLSTTSLAKLISKIDAKISQSDNIQLKASMVNLEGIAHERSMEALLELKEDIEQITEFVNDLKVSQKEKKVEAVKIEIV